MTTSKNDPFAKDIRYSELVFLRTLENQYSKTFNPMDQTEKDAVGLMGNMYVEMAATLIEDLYVRFHDDETQLYVAQLRGELGPTYRLPPFAIAQHFWDNPREALRQILNGQNKGLVDIRITYRGLRRIRELRDVLRSERILEPFGVLLSKQYFLRDLQEGLKSDKSSTVSVFYADIDNFKQINTNFGHKAGDVVMNAYLEVVRDCLGSLGTGYRGLGDEVVALLIGQGHERVVEIAEEIRKRIEALRCRYDEKDLPQVTASIGVATTPPESRTADVEILAEERQQQAKDSGKNRVIAQ